MADIPTPVDTKQRFFPTKPVTEAGFKEPVSWLGGRELIASLKGVIIYAIYGETMDPRPWMKPNVHPPIAETGIRGEDLEKEVTTHWQAETLRQWDWKRRRFPGWEEYLDHHEIPEDEYWFDYIADSGDGQMAVYGVACMCLSDLWLTDSNDGSEVTFAPASLEETTETLLPRGSFLFVGGDTAYHTASYEALHERFQLPFMWALASVRRHLIRRFGGGSALEKQFVYDGNPQPIFTATGDFNANWDGTLSTPDHWDTEPLRPIFGIPGNHDYYDDLDGFNRQFRRPPYWNVEENKKDASHKGTLLLKLPTYARMQEASYTAIRLPFGWTMLGIDSENEKLDFRQKVFFNETIKGWDPKKMILATSEPTTVFGRAPAQDDKTVLHLTDITSPIGLKQPFFVDGELKALKSDPTCPKSTPSFPGGEYCRLDLSGDTHHYARYWGPQDKDGQPEFSSDNYASVVAGGGGAFFDSTSTLVGWSQVTRNGKKEWVHGAIPPQKTFPNGPTSVWSMADRIINLWNIRKGGYVQIIGGIAAALLASAFFFLEPVASLVDGRYQRIADLNSALTGVSLLLTFAALLISLILLRRINACLRDPRCKPDDRLDTIRPAKLILPVTFLILGIAIYMFFFLGEDWSIKSEVLQNGLVPFFQDLLFALQIVCSCLLFAISNQYLNWYVIRFKLIQQMQTKAKGGPTTPTENIVGDAEIRHDVSLVTKLREFIVQLSPGKIPAFAICLVAVAFLVLGTNTLGERPLRQVTADIVIALLILGSFVGIIYLAVAVGAVAQTGVRKYLGFGLLGLIHAALQLTTAITLLYWGDWRLLLAIWVLTVLTNGFGLIKAGVDFVLGEPRPGDSSFKKIIRGVATARFAAWLMKHSPAAVFLAAWLLYGVVVLASPFVLRQFIEHQTVFQLVAAGTDGSAAGWWIRGIELIGVAFCVGYRMSCLWFSWYLGVSLLFNGHNNETGGAARMEGFKHILRIKVTEKRLTVYVIGFEHAKTELEKLEPKLVDRFDLDCSRLDPAA